MTRANIFVCDTFVAEIGGDAYPGGDLWKGLSALGPCTEAEFMAVVKEYAKTADENPCQVGNWSYEFLWQPVEQPEEYKDWDNWKGLVMVREPDPRTFTKGKGLGSYWMLPGRWQELDEFQTEWKPR